MIYKYKLEIKIMNNNNNNNNNNSIDDHLLINTADVIVSS